ncbi:MAG: acyl-CoA dehydrogenase family protein, partial [bacterium]
MRTTLGTLGPGRGRGGAVRAERASAEGLRYLTEGQAGEGQLDFSLTAEQQELRRSAREFLADQSSSEQVREAMQGERGWDQGVWQRVAGEMGWTAVALPEQYGGYGLGAVELSVLMEEMGAALLCAPFFSTVCLAANALLLAGSEEQKQQWLPRIAAGKISAALAFAENDGSREAGGIQATATTDGDGWRLDGVKSFVVDGATADLLVVAAREAGGSSPDDIALFLIEAGTDGLACVQTPGMDHTRRLARVELKGVRLEAEARMVGGWAELEGTLDLASVALAAEQLGGATRVLDAAVAYAKERRQFGRPIGGFQAIKHK